jgi:ABC-type dipeptide/oligopeptide/nickel transport system permease subunit
VFAVQLNWLPAAGAEEPGSVILPSLSLASFSIALVARMTRSTMLEVLGQDFVRTARAKGLREYAVVYRHALRNALIPIITAVGLQFGALLGLVIGVPLGAVSGVQGGLIDLPIQRLVDVLLSFPGFLLALSLVSMLGVGLQNVIIAVGISAIPSFIRLVRGSVLSLREQVFVEAARALGQRPSIILWRHVLPNAMAPIIVQATLNLGSSILVAAGLGFLGLGVQPPTAEWGTMLGEGRQYTFRAPLLTLFPGLAIFLAVLGFNRLGDGLRDALEARLPQLRT